MLMELRQRFASFVRVIKPLKVELDKWHNLLIGHWAGKNDDSRTYKFKKSETHEKSC